MKPLSPQVSSESPEEPHGGTSNQFPPNVLVSHGKRSLVPAAPNLPLSTRCGRASPSVFATTEATLHRMSYTWRGGASPIVFATTEAAPAICWSRLGWRGGTSRPNFEAGTRHAASRTSSFGAVMLGPHTAWGSLWKEASFRRARTRRCRSACGSGRQRFVEKARPGVAPSLQNVVFRYRVYANFPGRVHLLRGAVAPSPVSALE